jgi:integrase
MMTTPAGHSVMDLALQSVVSDTAKRYTDAVCAYFRWAARHSLVHDSIGDFDINCTKYAVDVFHRTPAHKGRQHCINLQYGLGSFFPLLKTPDAFPLFKRSMKGWNRLVRKVPWAPITFELASLIAATLVKSGFADMGLAVLLSFSSLLRISECCSLRVKDIAFRGDSRMGSLAAAWPATLTLKHTKTGDDMWARVRHEEVAALLRSHLSPRPLDREAPLFLFTKETFRKRFKQAVRAAGIPLRLVPHGLRHGGATDAFARGMSLEMVMMLGRWAVTSSTRHYIQMGPALLMDKDLDQALADLGSLFMRNLVLTFALASSAVAPLRLQGKRRAW